MPRAALWIFTGDQLFAGAGLTENQDRHFGGVRSGGPAGAWLRPDRCRRPYLRSLAAEPGQQGAPIGFGRFAEDQQFMEPAIVFRVRPPAAS